MAPQEASEKEKLPCRAKDTVYAFSPPVLRVVFWQETFRLRNSVGIVRVKGLMEGLRVSCSRAFWVRSLTTTTFSIEILNRTVWIPCSAASRVAAPRVGVLHPSQAVGGIYST